MSLRKKKISLQLISFLFFVSLFFSFSTLVFAQGTATPPAPPTPANCSDPILISLLKAQGQKDPQFSAILPRCVYYEGTSLEQTCGCRNVNNFIEMLTIFANWLFGIVGAVALVMFIYGGFVFLTSAGSSERVTKGKTILVSAVVGLVIIFTAQMGVKFLLKTVIYDGEDGGGKAVGVEVQVPAPPEPGKP